MLQEGFRRSNQLDALAQDPLSAEQGEGEEQGVPLVPGVLETGGNGLVSLLSAGEGIEERFKLGQVSCLARGDAREEGQSHRVGGGVRGLQRGQRDFELGEGRGLPVALEHDAPAARSFEGEAGPIEALTAFDLGQAQARPRSVGVLEPCLLRVVERWAEVLVEDMAGRYDASAHRKLKNANENWEMFKEALVSSLF